MTSRPGFATVSWVIVTVTDCRPGAAIENPTVEPSLVNDVNVGAAGGAVVGGVVGVVGGVVGVLVGVVGLPVGVVGGPAGVGPPLVGFVGGIVGGPIGVGRPPPTGPTVARA